MKVGIMQPYLLPYIGYFQLIAAVDQFVVYDNIKYTKKGWINRNRFLLNGKDALFTVPLRSASDSAAIVERQLASEFQPSSILNRFEGAYAKSPYFSQTFPALEEIFEYTAKNLFDFIWHSLAVMTRHLGIETCLVASSSLPSNRQLTGQDRVISICQTLGATQYINPEGGVDLYSPGEFDKHGIELRFLRSKALCYSQFNEPFISNLSIIDVLMFNPLRKVSALVTEHFEWVTRD